MDNILWQIGDKVDNIQDLQELFLQNRLGQDLLQTDFLHPQFVLPDPFLLPDMDKAVERIARAIENKERILIYGDYDADGVTSLALLYELLFFWGITPEVYIPDRFSEGYGLRYGVLEKYFLAGTNLVITVDCGIRDVEIARQLLEKGWDLIITDHHEPGTKIPEAVAVVNPKLARNSYPERELAGVGVVYALARALMTRMNVDAKEQEKFLKWNLDLVALGTVADMVPLLGENRILVKYGLISLAKSKKFGLRYLRQMAGIDKDILTSEDISFGLAPRINASGRLDNASYAFNLLIEKGDLEAEVLAKGIEQKNQERKMLTENIWQDVLSQVDANNLPGCIVLIDDGWSKGVLGLIASKVMRRFYRPAIIATVDGEEIVASARSVEEINIVDILEQNQQYLFHFGGHKRAAGLTVKKNQWNEFINNVQNIIASESLLTSLVPKVKAEAEIDLGLVGDSIWDLLNLLQPWGVGNEEPLLGSYDCLVVEVKKIGKEGNHLKFNFLTEQGKIIQGIWWSGSLKNKNIDKHDKVDVIYRVQKELWNGRENFLLNIVDMRKRDE